MNRTPASPPSRLNRGTPSPSTPGDCCRSEMLLMVMVVGLLGLLLSSQIGTARQVVRHMPDLAKAVAVLVRAVV